MTTTKDLPIGVFDSGVGGISVLCALQKALPNETYLYYADSKHAPYGTQTVHQVKEHTLRVYDTLQDTGIKALVVACNTATSAAIEDLRSNASIPIIGMEPALKPAIRNHNHGKILVMATPMTLKESKFQRLLERWHGEAHIELLPAPTLVELVEAGKSNSSETQEYLTGIFSRYERKEISAVVLGCTHFVFVRPLLQYLLGDSVALIDGNIGTAKHLKNVLKEQGLLSKMANPSVHFITSADNEVIKLCHRLYNWCQSHLY